MLTIKEATEKFGISETTLRRWTKEKLLPYSYEIIDFRRVLVIEEEQIKSLLLSRFGTLKSKKTSIKTKSISEVQLDELKNLLTAVNKLLVKIIEFN